MDGIERQDGTVSDFVLGHQPNSRTNRSIRIDDMTFLLWNEERIQFDLKLLQLYETMDQVDPPNQERKRKKSAVSGTTSDFMNHLLDVHRSWCQACRPERDFESRLKKSECNDQATQTLQTMPDMFSSSQPMKPMPPLARIKTSHPQQKIIKSTEPVTSELGIKREHDPSFKGPNIKLIKIWKTKGGLFREESCMSQQNMERLVHTGQRLGMPLQAVKTTQASQPVQLAQSMPEVVLQGSPQLQASFVLPNQNLPTVSPLQVMQVLPGQKSQPNAPSSSLFSGVITASPPLVKLPSPSVSSSAKQSISHDSDVEASSDLGEGSDRDDTLSFSDGPHVPGLAPLVPSELCESMDSVEEMHDVELGWTPCVDEEDNAGDDSYDDDNLKLEKKEPEVSDHAYFIAVKDHSYSRTVTVKGKGKPSKVHSVKKESLFDQLQDQESDSSHTPWVSDKEDALFDEVQDQDSKSFRTSQNSETEIERGRVEEEEEKTEDEEEEVEVKDEEDDDGYEVDYEVDEVTDPTYEPHRRKSTLLSKGAKNKPRSSKDTSSTFEDDQDEPPSDESEDSLEYAEDSDEDLRDRPAKKRQTRKHSKASSLFPGECPLCFTHWNTRADMNSHMQTHIVIDQGQEAFNLSRVFIERKIGNEYTRKMGWCEGCDKFCSSLTAHVQNVHKKKKWRRKTLCPQCGKMVLSLEMHLLTHLEVDEKDYVKCPKCPSTFKHEEYIQRHLKYAHSSRHFKCHTCGKEFKNAYGLRKHEKIHSAVKPFPCSVCEKSFTQKSNLKVHMRQHTGHQPYVCEFCERAFTNKVSLKNHKKKLHGIDWWKDREALNNEELGPTASNENE